MRAFSPWVTYVIAPETLTPPASDQVVYQDDHCDHYQDVNQIATDVADESE